MALEEELESMVRSMSLQVEIAIQKLKKDGNKLNVPGATNYYRGAVEFGKKTKVRKTFEKIGWRALFWEFNLGGFVDMSFLDSYHFDRLNYDLEHGGEKVLLGRLCRVYRVEPKKQRRGRQFKGTIWVLANESRIIRFEGASWPMHRIYWPFLAEDFWFSFDSWRKEISPGVWAPDHTCAGGDVAKGNFVEPAFRAQAVYFYGNGERPGASSGTVCEMELGAFPAGEIQKDSRFSVTRK